MTTDRAPAYPRVLDELLPAAHYVTEQYANNRIEADHGRLKALFVDDAVLAVGVLVAVGVAAGRLSSHGDALGWILFGLIWVAVVASMSRAGRNRTPGR